MSKKLRSRLKRAALAGIAMYGASKMLGAQKTAAPIGAPASAKTPASAKKIGKQRVVDTGAKTGVGTPVKTTVDKGALPREIEEKTSAVRAANEKMKKPFIKRRDEGKLSPTMPKRANQISSDFGLGIMDGAKKGKMIKARGGGLAKGGMRPTKLY